MPARTSLILAATLASSVVLTGAAPPSFVGETDNIPTSFPCGKSLVIPLAVDDPDGDTISYTVTSSNPKILARVRTGHLHYKVHVQSGDDGSEPGVPHPFEGDMEFQLFRDTTPETAGFIAGFAQSGYYDNVKFHRVIPDFVIQGGDPAGTGSGASPYTIRHEFRPELIYTGRAQLAMANSQGGYAQSFPNNGHFRYRTGSFSPTNGSQFFVTLGQPRHLDFKHTLFGQLVRGFATLDRIESVLVVDADGPDDIPNTGDEDTRPVTDVHMTTHQVSASRTDGMLLLSATSTGDGTITVTARDPSGATATRTINVTSVVDTINDPPMLLPFEPEVAPVGSLPSFSIRSFDLEHDAISTRFPVQDFLAGGNVIYAGVNFGNLMAAARPDVGAWDVTIGVSGLNDPLLDIDPFNASRFEKLEIGVGDKAMLAQPKTLQATATTDTGATTVATFRHGSAGASADDYIAIVNWGDGSTPQNTTGGNPAVTIVRSATQPGAFEVKAAHIYARPGVYPLHVTIDGPLGATQTAKGAAVVSAPNAVLRAAGEEIRHRGPSINGRPLAYFTDTTPGARPVDYEITIDWGDGQRKRGTARQVGIGRFAVFGTHRYTDAEAFSTVTHIARKDLTAQTVAWGRAEVTGFVGPVHLPPFSKTNITILWSEDPVKVYRKLTATTFATDINATLFVINGGDKPTGKWKLRFWLSTDAVLNLPNTPADTQLKFGPLARQMSELSLNSLQSGAGGNLELKDGSSGDLTIHLPGIESGVGKFIIAEVVYSDPITDRMKVAKTLPFGPLSGIIVSPTSISVREDGASNLGTATFQVKLDMKPTANVTIPLDIALNGNPITTRASLSTQELVFTPENGTNPITVTVTATDDHVQNAQSQFTIRVKPATSTDTRFNNMDPRDVALQVVDHPRNVIVSPAAVTVVEGNASAIFNVKLQSLPSSPVTIPIQIVDAQGNPDNSRALLDKAQLVFTSTNGATNQAVTVTAVDDDLVNGTGNFRILIGPAVSAPGEQSYNGRAGIDVTLTVNDNEAAGAANSPPEAQPQQAVYDPNNQNVPAPEENAGQ